MGTTLSSLNRRKRPSFYNNISGLPQTNRSDSGGVVNSSVIPIIQHINQTLTFPVDSSGNYWNEVAVGHGIGKVYYVFARWRVQGDKSWTMCPQPNYDSPTSTDPPKFSFFRIDPSSITFLYFDAKVATTPPLKVANIEVDIYFVDIPFNV